MFLSQPLADAMTCLSKEVFPDNRKIASSFPISKQPSDINKVSNFSTVSVINIYESVLKNQLISVSNKIFSSYIAAYSMLRILKHTTNANYGYTWKFILLSRNEMFKQDPV